MEEAISPDEYIKKASLLMDKALKQSPIAALGARFSIHNTPIGVNFSVESNVPEMTVQLYAKFRELLIKNKVIKGKLKS